MLDLTGDDRDEDETNDCMDLVDRGGLIIIHFQPYVHGLAAH